MGIRRREGRSSWFKSVSSSWFKSVSSSSGDHINGGGEKTGRRERWREGWPRRKLGSAFSCREWEKRLRGPPAALGMAAFRVLYVVEAVVLGGIVCCFFCRFGCRL